MKRTHGEVIGGVWVGPNACATCEKWLPPYKDGVPMDVADQYCWGHPAREGPDPFVVAVLVVFGLVLLVLFLLGLDAP